MAVSVALFCVFSAMAQGDTDEPTRMKPALLVIDIQNAFLPYMADADKKLALEMINAAIYMFREADLPIIHVYHTDEKWGPQPGTPEYEFPEEILVDSADSKISKNYPSAFKKTDLEKTLREKGVNTVFLCGLSATGCVLATYHTAQDLDFDVFMIKNALLSPNTLHTDVIEDICDAIGYSVLQTMLNNIIK
ncbi:isochorismatase family protein [candidate division KSB1 bacterium]|nr:isochorismatase family protein [candidate division KSB1 bacterium]